MTPVAPLTLQRTPTPPADLPVIEVDPGARFQRILGMGGSLEATTCSNLWRMAPATRREVLRRLLDAKTGIGMNLMRVCIGTSDFTGDPWYSYDDLPPGMSDPELARFSIEKDRAYLLPILKLAREIRPDLRFFASPWSPPGWMKTTGSLIGGELKPGNYATYARYLVRFIRAYEAEGIPILALTVQNEPGVDRSKEKDPKWYYPSCHWTGEQERNFIRDHLGPALKAARLKTRIWCYDHNYNELPSGDDDGISHPRTILSDPAAARFVDGVGFHGYAGKPTGMSVFHREFPTKPLYFTEGSVFSPYGSIDLIERFRNWAQSYNAWVLILDEKGKPNNGPFAASRAAIRLHSDTLEAEYLFEFYNYGHFTREIPPGSTRIGTTAGTFEFSNVAFQRPDGSYTLVVANATQSPRSFALHIGRDWATGQLPPRAVQTLSWR